MSAPCQDIIEDIEDLISSQDITPKERYSTRKNITVRPKSKQLTETVPEIPVLSSIVPGTQTIYVKTWGCTHNSSDTEYMAGQLSSYGYKLTENKYEADLWLLNSCTVKNPAEDHFRNEIENGKKLGKHVVVAGCVPQGAPKSSFLQGLSMIGVQQIDRVVEVVEETLKGNTVRFLHQKKQDGCLNQCTYCKTKHARGELGSYPPEEIVERAKQAFNEGVCELWLTSEDTGTYGRDIGTSLPELLWKLIEVVPDGCMIRVGMTNPPYILEHLQEMSLILSHPKVYSFLHVPVQSGSDQVLADMKREYTRADFEQVVDFLQERVPGLTIATDIICGFPTETEDYFEETMDLCKKYNFPSLFINQFFARPGTPAARMPKVPTQEVKKRTKRLSEYFQTYSPYNGRIGLVQDVLVTEVSHDKNHYVGHNKSYEQVLVPLKEEYLGKMIKVKIVETSKYSMKGEPMIKGTSPALKPYLPKGTVSGIPVEMKPSKYRIAAILAIFLAVIFRLLWKFLMI
ncbi:Threonylcarbamoyladenosine tRNA methylthiotransferase [Anthophora retusa]